MKKENKATNRKSYSVLETINFLADASIDAVTDLQTFVVFLESFRLTASKETHYKKLEHWTGPVYNYAHNMLKKYGFVNGDPEANNKNPDARFWWSVYNIVSNVIYSPHLKSEVANHHSSAYDRNEALILEIQDVLSSITIK